MDWATLGAALIAMFGAMAIEGIGLLIWSSRFTAKVEGRLNGHDQLFAEREKQMDNHWDEIHARLVRIEKKLDENGSNNGR